MEGSLLIEQNASGLRHQVNWILDTVCKTNNKTETFTDVTFAVKVMCGEVRYGWLELVSY